MLYLQLPINRSFLLLSFLLMTLSHLSKASPTSSSPLSSCPAPFSRPDSTASNSSISSSNQTTTASPLLWTVSAWETDYTLPDGGSIIFRLSNPMTGYNALCYRRGLYPEGYCVNAITPDSEGSAATEEDMTATLFQYYDKVGLLELYQEWDCLDLSSNMTNRVQADGQVIVVAGEQCKPGDEMKNGNICGAQGGGGKVYASLMRTQTEMYGQKDILLETDIEHRDCCHHKGEFPTC
ncbi:hypothetical protein B0H66DRAFT_533990 [Apodospora peruviana]|uniref:Uncharacterized protein n=1 Tax=Apodospora peruviana TaxID=516989 RepID=A0AAE0HZL3_9PEZI|nr:hypothetical protein B0H66DRAFT_533990 [Apodospora peruviana]